MREEGTELKLVRVADEMMALQRRLTIQSLVMLVVGLGGAIVVGLIFNLAIPVWVEAPFFVFIFWRGITAVFELRRVFSRGACPGCGEKELRLHPHDVRGSNVACVKCKHCDEVFETDLKSSSYSRGMFERRWE
jgi:hypothetical protein